MKLGKLNKDLSIFTGKHTNLFLQEGTTVYVVGEVTTRLASFYIVYHKNLDVDTGYDSKSREIKLHKMAIINKKVVDLS